MIRLYYIKQLNYYIHHNIKLYHIILSDMLFT